MEQESIRLHTCEPIKALDSERPQGRIAGKKVKGGGRGPLREKKAKSKKETFSCSTGEKENESTESKGGKTLF